MYHINPVKFYGNPEINFHKKLWEKLLKKYESITNIAKVFKLNIRQLYKWKELKNNYPLIVLINLAKDVNLAFKLEYIKTRRFSDIIKNPKLGFHESCQLIEFFGHLLHDGGIDKQYGVHYTTHSKKLADRFENLVKCCFGEMNVERKEYKNKTTLYYPVVLGYILNGTFKIHKGSKVKNDIGIPSFIKNSSKEKKWLYIITSYVCDGINKRVAITASSNSIYEPPQLLKDIKYMLNMLGINSVVIKESYVYKTKKEEEHKAWILRIIDRKEKIIFNKYLRKYGNFCG